MRDGRGTARPERELTMKGPIKILGWGYSMAELSNTAHLVVERGNRGEAYCGVRISGQVQKTVPAGLNPCRTCARAERRSRAP